MTGQKQHSVTSHRAGEIAVVTGGTRGIGAAVVRRLTDLGYRTFSLARSIPTAAPQDRGCTTQTNADRLTEMVCDISDEDSVASTFSEISAHGRITVLINNAGISSSDPIRRTTLQDWNRNFAVNATGPFLCTRAVLPAMIEHGGGHIITVASTASLEGSAYVAAYAASKHAVLGLMRVLAAEVEGTGIITNSVCPTFVRTEMTTATIANIARRTGASLLEAEAKLANATPHRRVIEIVEVVDLIMHLLASNKSGQEILLDGGNSD